MILSIKKIIFLLLVAFCISQAGGWTSVSAYSACVSSGSVGVAPTVPCENPSHSGEVQTYYATQTVGTYRELFFNSTCTVDLTVGYTDVYEITCPTQDHNEFNSFSYSGSNPALYYVTTSNTDFLSNYTFGAPSTDPYLNVVYPTDSSTIADFMNWQIEAGNIDTSTYLAKYGIHYSTDATLLATCEDYPYSVGFPTCQPFSGTRIETDYGYASSIETIGTANIEKQLDLVLGQTYYVQAVIQKDDSNGEVVLASDIISFTVGSASPAEGVAVPSSCSTFDFLCWIKQGVAWTFGVSDSVLQQFSTLTLENSVPFSYLYDMGNIWDELFSNSGSLDYAVSVPFMGSTLNLISKSQIESVPFASTIKTLLGYLIYLYTALTLYRMLLSSHSSKH